MLEKLEDFAREYALENEGAVPEGLDIDTWVEVLVADNFEVPGFDELPVALQPELFAASIGFEPVRAILVLQSVVNQFAPQRYIDGVLHAETIDAATAVLERVGYGVFSKAYARKLNELAMRLEAARKIEEQPAAKGRRKNK